jgi:hypothetical protein
VAWTEGSLVLNPLNFVFSLLGRFIERTTPKVHPLPDPDGRQGFQEATRGR